MALPQPYCNSLTNRTKLVVAYDGTDFRGWAAQTGQRTVQSTLTEAVRRVSGEDIEIVGASRTDSGAHARGQVCHFDSSVGIEPETWARALNDVLPLDVGVLNSSGVPESFESRFCAIDRWYRYRILIGRRNPLKTRFAHSVWKGVDLESMVESSKSLVGLHDFRAYTEELDKSVENTMRRLFRVDVVQVRDEVQINIAGTAFLRGMMRRIAGGLLEVGLGKRDPADIGKLLTESHRKMHLPVVLPANGLTLMKVRYGRWPTDNRKNSLE